MSPKLAKQYATLKSGQNLDLDSRKGKRPGGYQSSLEESREPFIFMNAAGLHRDVETMLHEAGHAFHYMAVRNEPLMFVRHAPIEFCEVASMSMELLGLPYMTEFYDESDAARAARAQFEGNIRLLPWIATIDQFQHWLYTHSGHSGEQRTEAWLSILDRFTDEAIDFSGYEDLRASMWQRQIHLFHYPFYYVEYGIAQLGALQVWVNSQSGVQKALDDYLNGLKLGGTQPLPSLFEASNIKFDFTQETLGPLMDAVSSRLEALPV